jgi:predicted glycoside hydrolase/deacetylase ChbG (UPF0249 family)
MVFMADSARAAAEASEAGLDTGFHLNLDRPLTARQSPSRLRELQEAVGRYLNYGKWAQIVYNPFLKRSVEDVFHYQLDEYRFLFGREPSHINGHHHRHLCMNMLVGRVIPPGFRVRRNFSLERGHSRSIEDWYRYFVDLYLVRRFRCTDWFFSIEPTTDRQRFERIIQLALSSNVELMVHPAKAEQLTFLMSAVYRGQIESIAKGPYSILPVKA